MNWPQVLAEVLEAVAAVLRRHATVSLDAPVSVRAAVPSEVRSSSVYGKG